MIRPFARPLFRAPLLAASLACALAIVIAPASAQQAQKPAAQPAKPAAAPAKPATTPAKPAATPAKPAGAAATNPQRPAAAATGKPAPAGKPAPSAGPAGASATLVASFADWSVYTAPAGRSKVCYALTQPKDRQPKNLTRDPAYLFVSFRPAENVRNEVALVMGFATREDGPAEAAIGNASYALLTKEQNAWLKNPAEEGQAISTMSKGQNLTVKAQSRRGNQLTDRYSLNGFGLALERARKECAS